MCLVLLYNLTIWNACAVCHYMSHLYGMHVPCPTISAHVICNACAVSHHMSHLFGMNVSCLTIYHYVSHTVSHSTFIHATHDSLIFRTGLMYSLFFHRWLMTELDGLPRKMAVQKAGNMLYIGAYCKSDWWEGGKSCGHDWTGKIKGRGGTKKHLSMFCIKNLGYSCIFLLRLPDKCVYARTQTYIRTLGHVGKRSGVVSVSCQRANIIFIHARTRALSRSF